MRVRGRTFRFFIEIHVAYFRRLDDNCRNDISASSVVLQNVWMVERSGVDYQIRIQLLLNAHVI